MMAGDGRITFSTLGGIGSQARLPRPRALEAAGGCPVHTRSHERGRSLASQASHLFGEHMAGPYCFHVLWGGTHGGSWQRKVNFEQTGY